MKKLVNQPDRVVEEMVEGLLGLYPGLSRLAGLSVLLRSDYEIARERQVTAISGGGSGHEPAHAGFIGPGMLSAAVAGEIFTSPSAASVLAAIRAVAGSPGVLLIVKNYTGDRLNFGLAAEMARAEGILVDTVIVADDVALAGAENEITNDAGRRGIAGTVLVHKIAGAAAAEGKDLSQVVSAARAAAEDLGSMGVSLSAGTSPATGKPSFTLGEEVELGLGIHGEPGMRRMPLRSANELTDELLDKIVATLRIVPGERVVALINNLGATTTMELAIVARHVLLALKSLGIVVERMYSGTFISSLDMAGISISLLRVDDERLKWLDAPTRAPGWPSVLAQPPGLLQERTINVTAAKPISTQIPDQAPQTSAGKLTEKAIAAACVALIAAEDRLTELDRAVGDGDLGINLARGARAVRDQSASFPLDRPAEALQALGLTLQEAVGGSSGPLYGAFLLRTGTSLASATMDDPQAWALAIAEGCQAMGELGGAALGDRTMLDTLIPFAHTLKEKLASGISLRAALREAAAAAENGAESTTHTVARRGRSSYLGQRALGFPDPGALAVAIWLRAVTSVISP